jgi:hypothetical protein
MKTAAEKLFKKWRIHGMEEDELRRLVAKFGGDYWEEFFENEFGYEAKIRARNQIAQTEGLRTRKQFAAWRDPILNRIDTIQKARQEAREKKFLLRVESKKLEAEGLNRRQARSRARDWADNLVDKAAEYKSSERSALNRKPMRMSEMTEDGDITPKRAVKPLGMKIREKFDLVIGGKVRFLLGALLIAGGSLWVRQNLNAFKLELPTDKSAAVSSLKTLIEATDKATPLHIPLVPTAVTGLFNYFNPLLAGFLLLFSLFLRGGLQSICFLCGAAVAFAGYKFGIPEVAGIRAEIVAMAAGLGMGILGYLLARPVKAGY